MGKLVVVIAGLLLSGCDYAGREAVAEARGVTRGQCSMMDWYLQTRALKELDERATRINYERTCQDYQAQRRAAQPQEKNDAQ